MMASKMQEANARSSIIAAGRALLSQKGFSAVGLSEILRTAGVPKGSFYHYFGSKDDFGAALLCSYFDEYHAEMDQLFARPGLRADEKLMLYFASWLESQAVNQCQGRCLVVKLGAEVSDLSDPMRRALHNGTDGIISRLEAALQSGVEGGTLSPEIVDQSLAVSLYQLWIGASVMAKITRNPKPLDAAMLTTRKLLGSLSAV